MIHNTGEHMKKITQSILTLLFGLLSMNVMAETNATQATQPDVQIVQQAVENTQKIANPNVVNINLATAAELQDKLVGIGAKKAQAIVDYREKNGKFVSIEQLTEVSGIGKATLDKNRDRIALE